jgi:phosphoribosylcarboxyaminoimidazole (NCAIR) mutase
LWFFGVGVGEAVADGVGPAVGPEVGVPVAAVGIDVAAAEILAVGVLAGSDSSVRDPALGSVKVSAGPGEVAG